MIKNFMKYSIKIIRKNDLIAPKVKDHLHFD